MRGFGAALVLGVVLVAAGCGDSEDPGSTPTVATTPTTAASEAAQRGPDSPTVADVSNTLRSKDSKVALGEAGGTYDKKTADCLATALVESQMSDEGIEDFLRGGQEFSDADVEAFRGVLPALLGCGQARIPGGG